MIARLRARRGAKLLARQASQHAELRARVLALADSYEAAGFGQVRPDGRRTPVRLGDIAAEIRRAVEPDGAVL